MRFSLLCLTFVTFALGWNSARAGVDDRPRESSSASELQGKLGIVVGKVIEVRRVANGPVIFEIDGVPAKPQFRALVYPMAVKRFGADPETVYLGEVVAVKGVVQIRKDLPQTWINDPSSIRLATPEEVARAKEGNPAPVEAAATPTPAPK